MTNTREVHYAVASFDTKNGPVKSWSRLAVIENHNQHADEMAHLVKGATRPIVVWGSAELVASVKAMFVAHDIKRIRRNGVIGWEAMLTSGHMYFHTGDSQADGERFSRWLVDSVAFALKHWKDRVAQITLHRNEFTPHLHVLVIPLKKVTDGRFGARWTLDVSTIAGPGKWQAMHDAYGKAMAPLGLTRGKAGSGRKYRPFADLMAELEAEQKKTREAEEAAKRAEHRARKAEEANRALNAELVQRLAEIASIKSELVLETEAAKKACSDMDAANAEALKHAIEAGSVKAKWKEFAGTMLDTLKTATDFKRALVGIRLETLPADILSALALVEELKAAISAVVGPQNDAEWDAVRNAFSVGGGGKGGRD